MGMRMKHRNAAPQPTSSIEQLDKFRRRHPFHDMAIERIVAVNRRVIVRLADYTLVVTQVSKFTNRIEEFPTSWLYDKWEEHGDSFALTVEAEFGELEIVGRDVRLIRNSDMAILIPPIEM